MPLTSEPIRLPHRVALLIVGVAFLGAGGLLLWVASRGRIGIILLALPVTALGTAFLAGGLSGRNFGWTTVWADDDAPQSTLPDLPPIITPQHPGRTVSGEHQPHETRTTK